MTKTTSREKRIVESIIYGIGYLFISAVFCVEYHSIRQIEAISDTLSLLNCAFE